MQNIMYQSGWKCPGDRFVICSQAEGFSIFINEKPKQKIRCLMEEFPHQEWIAYLIGKRQGNDYVVTDISIPVHKFSTAGSAEAEPFQVPENCIGIIHSHHSMGAFHSTTDNEYVDYNYPVSITVAYTSFTLEYDAVGLATTPCGKMTKVKCDVKYAEPVLLFDRETFIEEARSKIKTVKQNSTLDYRTVINTQKRFQESQGILIPRSDIEDRLLKGEQDEDK